VSMSFGQFQTHQQASIEVRPQAVPAIYGSPTALRTAVMNIVINARQALPEGGGAVTITTGVENEEVVNRIHDTGRGIPTEIMPHITEPFFTTKGEHGSGLGLSVARKVISCHDGRLEFNSTLDAGTTVTLRLPVCAEEPLAAAEPCDDSATTTAHGEVPNVLVVEDDVETLTHMVSSLAAMGLRPQGVRRAEEALSSFEEYLRSHQEAPPVLVTDLHLPGLLGTELARRVKQLAPNTRVILISGYITEEATQITCPYVDAIIKKPFRLPDLIKHMKPA
jgi:two-component system, cell cycle sensor histidine kinase and response regulator CckA